MTMTEAKVEPVKLTMKETPHSIVLLQGFFDKTFFDQDSILKASKVFVMENRPTLEAAQEDCNELLLRKITPTIISDNMAGFLFYKNLVKEIWIAYQLADEEGAVCDIGALILAVLGKTHDVPVFLFPSSRKTRFLGNPKDLTSFLNKPIAPQGIGAYVPLVDWVPMKYISDWRLS